MTNLEKIKSLRNQNKHEEAYQLSKDSLTIDPHNIWNRRAHCWSIYHLLKKHAQAGQTTQAQNFFKEYLEMELSPEETLLHERMAYFEQLLDTNILENRALVKAGKFAKAYDLLPVDSPLYDEAKAWTVYYMIRSHNKNKSSDHAFLVNYLNRLQSHVIPVKKLVFNCFCRKAVNSARRSGLA